MKTLSLSVLFGIAGMLVVLARWFTWRCPGRTPDTQRPHPVDDTPSFPPFTLPALLLASLMLASPALIYADSPVAFQVAVIDGKAVIRPVAIRLDPSGRTFTGVAAEKWQRYTLVIQSGEQTLLIEHGVDRPEDPDAPDDHDSPPDPPKDDLSAIKAKATEWAKLVPAASQGKFPAVQSAIRSAATAIRNGTLKTDKEADQALRVLLFNAVQGDFGWVAAGTAMNAEIERLKKAGLIPDVETYAVVLTYIADGLAP